MNNLIGIAVGSAFVSNIVLSQFLGICPFLGVSKKIETAVKMGVAVLTVVTIASLVNALIYRFLLVPFDLQYLQTIVFVFVIAGLVQGTEVIIKKKLPRLYDAFGIYLPLITTNCAILGVAITNIQKSYGIIESTVNGFATGIGFFLSIAILAGLREKMEYNNIPKAFKGMPNVLLTAGLMAIAFFGFSSFK